MKTRKEINKAIGDAVSEEMGMQGSSTVLMAVMIQLLLDIRDLVAKKKI